MRTIWLCGICKSIIYFIISKIYNNMNVYFVLVPKHLPAYHWKYGKVNA